MKMWCNEDPPPPAAPRILSHINHGNFTPLGRAMPSFDELISQLRMFQINLQTISPVQPNSIIDFWYYFYSLLGKPRAIQTTSSRTDRKHLWRRSRNLNQIENWLVLLCYTPHTRWYNYFLYKYWTKSNQINRVSYEQKDGEKVNDKIQICILNQISMMNLKIQGQSIVFQISIMMSKAQIDLRHSSIFMAKFFPNYEELELRGFETKDFWHQTPSS